MAITNESTYDEVLMNSYVDMLSIANEYSIPTDSNNQHEPGSECPFDYIMIAFETYIDDGGELSPDCLVAYVKDGNWFSMSDVNNVNAHIDVNIAKQSVVINIIRSDVNRINDAAHKTGNDYVRFGMLAYDVNNKSLDNKLSYNARPDGLWFTDYAIDNLKDYYHELQTSSSNTGKQ